ncbi:MBL fold metallo-hydrolase [Iamia sp. SCSIO 61187]|uniref:MBL fold metallo-hydrolase n=1 Tax=Iamia sp. SCSIO 61187 TaxID=2722752 RepID=UPI001C63250A|nr:MBL fold metallo-hydrolase [Iamia sp. SCSIO 61187]QYG95253.1 MBL fold metallo-hydrolase [Iamia sp. SCSIO 61187]
MDLQRWDVGAVRITRVVEAETAGIPTELFFPGVTAAEVQRIPWLVPDFAAEDGTIAFAVQAFVVEVGDRTIVVDPCVGNGKRLQLPFWNDQDWPFWARFTDAGFTAEAVDLVVHTHLHADHIGWDTRRDGDAWVPTFTAARHLYVEAELAHRRAADVPGEEEAYAESIQPIFDAGLADVVEPDTDLGDGLRLEPTGGHTPGHVSLWIESEGEVGLITGDFIHHPLQCAAPDTAEVADADVEEARATRHRLLETAATTGALVVGTHFPTAPAGRVRSEAETFRFTPVGRS